MKIPTPDGFLIDVTGNSWQGATMFAVFGIGTQELLILGLIAAVGLLAVSAVLTTIIVAASNSVCKSTPLN